MEEEDSGVEIDEVGEDEEVDIEEKRAREEELLGHNKKNKGDAYAAAAAAAAEGRKPEQAHTCPATAQVYRISQEEGTQIISHTQGCT